MINRRNQRELGNRRKFLEDCSGKTVSHLESHRGGNGREPGDTPYEVASEMTHKQRSEELVNREVEVDTGFGARLASQLSAALTETTEARSRSQRGGTLKGTIEESAKNRGEMSQKGPSLGLSSSSLGALSHVRNARLPRPLFISDLRATRTPEQHYNPIQVPPVELESLPLKPKVPLEWERCDNRALGTSQPPEEPLQVQVNDVPISETIAETPPVLESNLLYLLDETQTPRVDNDGVHMSLEIHPIPPLMIEQPIERPKLNHPPPKPATPVNLNMEIEPWDVRVQPLHQFISEFENWNDRVRPAIRPKATRGVDRSNERSRLGLGGRRKSAPPVTPIGMSEMRSEILRLGGDHCDPVAMQAMLRMKRESQVVSRLLKSNMRLFS